MEHTAGASPSGAPVATPPGGADDSKSDRHDVDRAFPPGTEHLMSAPDLEAARGKYRRTAGTYDRRIARTERWRRQAIERLLLTSGDVVLDVGSGTGINFGLLEPYVGPSGRIVGIDASSEMAARAEDRVKTAGWVNVELIEAPIEHASLPPAADAALFSLTHDILQSRQAVENVVRALKPGGRVASFGAKWAPWWAVPVNLGVWTIARRYVTTFSGFRKPWAHLEAAGCELSVEEVAMRGAYLAWGQLKATTTNDNRKEIES
jgi:ubiquinone/menaquinone biosynthesis C-methylase UbiE